MKKSIILAFAAMILAVVGCQKEEAPESVSFETSIPVVADGVASINIITSYVGTDPVTIPIEFGGTAVKGTDYTVSTEQFVLGGAAEVKTIQVTPLVYGSKKSVTLSLQIPSGFIAGNYPLVQFNLAEKLAYVSFEKKAVGMTENVDIKLALFDANGGSKVFEKQTEIAVEVDKEKSTAVEGVNFEFVGGKKAVFAAGESTGKVALKLKNFEEGKDLLVLNIVENPKYADGQYISTKVRLLGGIEALMGGKWVVKSFFPDKAGIVGDWGVEEAVLAGYPVFNAEDSFEIDPVEKKFIPSFKSEFKNYFVGESDFRKLDMSWYPLDRKSDTERTKKMSFSMTVRDQEVDRFMFENINRDFSAASKSSDKEGVVGFFIQENEDKTHSLVLVLMDYQPVKSFAHPMLVPDNYCGPEKGRKDGDKPVAHMGGVAILLECVPAK